MVGAKGQRQAVLNYLLDGNRITSQKAFKLFGATRLSAIIYDFREAGYMISSRLTTEKNRYGSTTTFSEYWIDEAFLEGIKNE